MPRPSRTNALLDKRALVALAAGVVTALATQLWWLLAPALALYLFLVRAAAQEAADPLAWEEPDLHGLAPRYRPAAKAGLEVQRRLHAELESAPAYLSEPAAGIWSQVRELGERELALLRQLQSVEEYLTRLNAQGLNAQWRDLAERRDTARDPSARAQYQQALASVENQMETVAELRAGAERMDAQLRAVHHTLENVYGQVLRLKTAGATGGEPQVEELSSTLSGLTQQVSALSDSVEQVYVRSGGGTG
jgi:hypothetical protein